MKKLLLSLSAVAMLATGMHAQAPSYNMENWTNVPFGTVQDPDGFASFNVLVVAGMTQSVYKETTAPYEATTAAKITTQRITGATIPGYDTVGLLILGRVQVLPTQAIKYGVNYTNMPATVTFATKYAPVTSTYSVDTGWVLVQLTKWNAGLNKADTIASGKFETSTASSAWTLQTIDLVPSYVSVAGSGAAPDTMKIYCSSSSLYHPNIGSALWVDDFKFNGYVGINDIAAVKNTVSVFPNPATNKISIECSVASRLVEVMDIAGRKMGTYTMLNNKAEIETGSYSNGMYMYNVIDENKNILNRGKFEVSK